MSKIIIFEHQHGHGEWNKSVEEIEFDDNATDEEITEEYIEWMVSLVADSCTWYEKDSEDDEY